MQARILLCVTMLLGRVVCAALPPQSAICVDGETGNVLYEENADYPRPPASVVKLMQLLLVAEGIEAGRWNLDTPITATKKAQQMGGSQVYLEAGETVSLGRLMQAVAVASANDAAMAMAEGLWGSEAAYMVAANARADALGMGASEFHSVHGLPPDRGELPDVTTARDIARLARACVTHPQILAWVSTKELVFRPGEATKHNTNKLLWRMPGCDGLKTGFIRAAGFCIAATAEHNGVRLVSVVLGSESKYGRFNLAQSLLEKGFETSSQKCVVAKGAAVGDAVSVRNCEVLELRLVARDGLWVARQESEERLELRIRAPQWIDPPVTAGKVVGEVQLARAGEVIARCPLIAPVNLLPLVDEADILRLPHP